MVRPLNTRVCKARVTVSPFVFSLLCPWKVLIRMQTNNRYDCNSLPKFCTWRSVFLCAVLRKTKCGTVQACISNTFLPIIEKNLIKLSGHEKYTLSWYIFKNVYISMLCAQVCIYLWFIFVWMYSIQIDIGEGDSALWIQDCKGD